jgi:hypothetical protein
MKFYFSPPKQEADDPQFSETIIQVSSDRHSRKLEVAQKLAGQIANKFGEAVQAHAMSFGRDEIEICIGNCNTHNGTIGVCMPVSAHLSPDELRERLIGVGMIEGLPTRH